MGKTSIKYDGLKIVVDLIYLRQILIGWKTCFNVGKKLKTKQKVLNIKQIY